MQIKNLKILIGANLRFPDRCFICIIQCLRFSTFILYPISFFLYSPVKGENFPVQVNIFNFSSNLCNKSSRQIIRIFDPFSKHKFQRRSRIKKNLESRSPFIAKMGLPDPNHCLNFVNHKFIGLTNWNICWTKKFKIVKKNP